MVLLQPVHRDYFTVAELKLLVGQTVLITRGVGLSQHRSNLRERFRTLLCTHSLLLWTIFIILM